MRSLDATGRNRDSSNDSSDDSVGVRVGVGAWASASFERGRRSPRPRRTRTVTRTRRARCAATPPSRAHRRKNHASSFHPSRRASIDAPPRRILARWMNSRAVPRGRRTRSRSTPPIARETPSTCHRRESRCFTTRTAPARAIDALLDAGVMPSELNRVPMDRLTPDARAERERALIERTNGCAFTPQVFLAPNTRGRTWRSRTWRGRGSSRGRC